jgi:hypothetical protein
MTEYFNKRRCPLLGSGTVNTLSKSEPLLGNESTCNNRTVGDGVCCVVRPETIMRTSEVNVCVLRWGLVKEEAPL